MKKNKKTLYVSHLYGFSLIELMIVIMIIAILAGIAYPAYRSYTLKSRRADAMTALLQDQMILERCYAQNFSYSASCTALPAYPHNSSQAYYSITLSNLGASTYTLTATAIGGQALDTTCSSLSVDQTNTKTASDASKGAQNSCWN